MLGGATERRERKVVTVLFCDLVGFTSRAEEMDPEDVAALLVPYHTRLKEELERYGGTVEKFIGDAAVAFFGVPIAHEDDPERAVRAAFAIRDFAEDEGIELRIGITTGEALVRLGARSDAGETMAAGDVVNTAARLQAAAPVNGILVGERTHVATSQAIEYEEHGAVEAKGKAKPVRVWLAARVRASPEPVHGARLVGRQRELDLLEDALARARQEVSPQLVTLVGVPGIGKSRLVHELAQRAGDVRWRAGRCLPYGDGVTFWALGEIVKAQTGILETDPAETAEEKLRAAVADDWVRIQLRPLVGLSPGAMGQEDRRDEAFSAWRRFLEGLAEERALVLVFEDVHWADDAMLDFVDHLVEWASAVELLVLCTARPELLERRPAWAGGKRNALTLSISPLTEEETTRLVSSLLERPFLPAATLLELLERAGGNPLYAEQYARMLEETEGGDGLPLPETVQGLIAARLDLLDVGQKGLLQDAAVVGEVFWAGALRALTGLEPRLVDELLHALERRGLVRRERRSGIEGDVQHAFHHVLVRDVAYGQIPRAERAEKHRLGAEWIESLGRPDDHAEMLAHHLVAAIDLGRAAGLDVTPLVPKAVQAMREAGDRAWALGAPGAALGFYERSRSLDPTAPDDPFLLLRLGRALISVHGKGDDELGRAAAALADSDPAAAAEAEMMRGELIWHRGDRDGAFLHFERAAAVVRDLPVSRAKAFVVSQVARFLTIAGRNREGLELAEQAIAMAEQLGDTELLGDTLNTRGVARASLGDPAWVDDLERSLALLLEANSRRASRAYINLGGSLMVGGEVARAEGVLREGLRFAERLDLILALRWTRALLAECTYHLGLWDEALRLAEGGIDDPAPHYMKQLCRRVRACVRLARGDADGSVADAEVAAEEARAIRDPPIVVAALTLRAFCAVSTGDAAGAAVALAELADTRRALEGSEPAGEWVLTLGFTLLELGDESQALEGEEDRPGVHTPWRDAARAIARGDLVRAADTCAQIGSKPDEAYARLRAAERLLSQRRLGEAEDQLERALVFYRSVGATRHAAEAEALLAATS